MTSKALWLSLSSCVGLQWLGLCWFTFLGHRMQNAPKRVSASSGQLSTAEAYLQWPTSWRQNCKYIVSVVPYDCDYVQSPFFIGMDKTAKINGRIPCFWVPIKSAIAKIVPHWAWWLQLVLNLMVLNSIYRILNPVIKKHTSQTENC